MNVKNKEVDNDAMPLPWSEPEILPIHAGRISQNSAVPMNAP
jgi:hypothetical protein